MFDEKLIHQVKILAAKQSASISGLFAENLVHLLKKDDAYHEAMAKALASMKRGYDLGGGNYLTRDEMYDRKNFH